MTGSQPAIRSDQGASHHRRTATTAAIILSLVAAGARRATARPADSFPPTHQSPAGGYSRPDRTMIPVTAPYVGAVAKTTAAPVVARVQAPQSGFDWGDAGIGAAGLALSVIGIGGAFAVSQRRSRRTTALPS